MISSGGNREVMVMGKLQLAEPSAVNFGIELFESGVEHHFG
jgi:hypothetical protein